MTSQNYTFIYSVKPNQTEQKEIISCAENPDEAYAQFITGLIKPATLVINKTTGRRII